MSDDTVATVTNTSQTEKPWLWKPGQSGNPNGRPKGTGYRQKFATRLAELLDAATDPSDPNSPTLGQQVIDGFLKDFREGDATTKAQLRRMLVKEDVLDYMDAIYQRERKEDMDFLAYRLQKGAGDHAQTILRSRETVHVHMAGRRGGKTDPAARWLVEPLIVQEGGRSLYMGLSLAKAMDQIWDLAIRLAEELGFNVIDKSRIDGRFVLSNGSVFQVSGNTTIDERNKQRGFWWNRIAIDECQSQKALPYLHDEIFGPTLLDKKGSLMFLGTGPRVRGTYWDELWTDLRSDGSKIGRKALRLNWNISDNPFIADREHALEAVRAEHGWQENNAVYIREYLGQIAYDDDALVWRLGEENYFADDQLSQWISSQPVADIRFSSGLDYGFEDADGFGIVVYSTSRPESYLVYEYKARRTGTQELATAIRAGLDYIATNPLFRNVENKHCPIYADTGGAAKKIGFDLATQYHLPIQDAFKANKDMAVELLQDEIRRRMFKVKKGGAFDEEALKTVFARNERDELTRVVDDETYHPDVADAILYAKRPIWLFQRR